MGQPDDFDRLLGPVKELLFTLLVLGCISLVLVLDASRKPCLDFVDSFRTCTSQLANHVGPQFDQIVSKRLSVK